MVGVWLAQRPMWRDVLRVDAREALKRTVLKHSVALCPWPSSVLGARASCATGRLKNDECFGINRTDRCCSTTSSLRGDDSRWKLGGGSEPASGASHATDGKRLAGVTAGQVTDLAGSRPLAPGEAFPAPSSGSQSRPSFRREIREGKSSGRPSWLDIIRYGDAGVTG